MLGGPLLSADCAASGHWHGVHALTLSSWWAGSPLAGWGVGVGVGGEGSHSKAASAAAGLSLIPQLAANSRIAAHCPCATLPVLQRFAVCHIRDPGFQGLSHDRE